MNRGGATSLLQQDIRHGLGVLADDSRYQSILRTVNDRLSEQKAEIARWEASGEVLLIPSLVTDPGQAGPVSGRSLPKALLQQSTPEGSNHSAQ